MNKDQLQRATFIYNSPDPYKVGSIAVQAIIPAQELGCKTAYFGKGMRPDEFLDRNNPSVVLITKINDVEVIELARESKSRGIPVVATFCDLRSERDEKDFALAKLADVIVTPNKGNADYVVNKYKLSATIIDEPVDMPRLPPSFSPTNPIKILYTGFSSNHDTLSPGVRNLGQFVDRTIALLIVSNIDPGVPKLQKIAPHVPISFLPYSEQIQRRAFAACDLVFVPSIDAENKKTKGQLRVLFGIQSGKPVIAYPLPQYIELQDYCFVGTDYANLLRGILDDPNNALRKVANGQKYIDARFSPVVCAKSWFKLIEKLINSHN